MKKILITGAMGTLGIHLIIKLLEMEESLQIYGLDIVNKPFIEFSKIFDKHKQKKFHYTCLNLNDNNNFLNYLQEIKPDYIVHLAASLNVSRNINHLDSLLKINFNPLITIIKYASNTKIERIVFTGTCEEYGFNNTPFDECMPIKPVSPYSLSKTLGSVLSDYVFRIHNLPIVFIRPFTFFGPFQRGNMFLTQLFKAILGENNSFDMSHGKQIREFNFVEDIAEGYVKALFTKNINGEIINLGRGNGYSLKEVVSILIDMIKPKIQINYGALPYRNFEIMNITSNPKKAKDLIKWNHKTSLEEALKVTYDWYKNNPDFLI